MDECKIVTDLLPTYCDELTSGETNSFMRAHLDRCPGCSRMLEQMQQIQQQQKEADIRRREFKAALAGYEQKHRTRVQLLVFVCVVLIAVFFIFRTFSFDLAISAVGLNRRDVTVVQKPTTDDNGKIFQVVCSETKEDDCVIAYVEKNILGFWTVKHVATPDKAYGVAQIIWSEHLFSNPSGMPKITTVFHGIYAGCNATDSLEKLPLESLPDNVTVMVTQHSDSYCIHVITVLPDGGTAYNILPLLKENNLIS